MPLTKFTTSQAKAFIDVSKNICDGFVSNNVTFNWTDYLLAHLPMEQVNQVLAVRGIVKIDSEYYRDDRIMVNRGMVEGFDAQLPNTAVIEWSRDGNSSFIPLTQNRMRNEHTERLEMIEDFLMRRALEVGILHQVLKFLVEKCTSVEAMRYLFPALPMLLRRMGEEKMASSVEEIKKRPPLPPMRPDERWRLRFINTWWAVRVLLDDFDGIQPDFSFEREGAQGIAKFDHTVFHETGIMSPAPHQEPGQRWVLYKSWP